jgi:elongator complex protein 3
MAHRPEMLRSAVIRELRVYGRTVRVGNRQTAAWQHRGLGVDLMHRMEKVAAEDFDARRLLVTSAVGTRNYYRKLGYEGCGPYMSRTLQ